MGSETDYENWATDAERLHELGRELSSQVTTVEVRVSRSLADKAVAAWQREPETDELPEETPEQRAVRHEAATWSLIGPAIDETGAADGEQVVFRLDAWLLGNALESADHADHADHAGALDP